jgi:NAD(P)-dependent dehydrogenase (short-subunit alcohol dehydrogenase family)
MKDKNPVAIITGAASGIGKACALRFAKERFRVVVVDKDIEAGQTTVNSLTSRGSAAIFCRADVAVEKDCLDFARQTTEAFGRIDVLVANAGIRVFGTLLETTAEDWDKMLAVNLKGVHLSCKAVLPQMIDQDSGAIVLIGSTTAMTGRTNMPIYDVTKFGVLSLNRSLAATYGKHGIRVNTICPSKTITEFHIARAKAEGLSPEALREQFNNYGLLGRAAEPKEIAAAVHFMASSEASFITGQYLMVDGGFSVGAKPFT